MSDGSCSSACSGMGRKFLQDENLNHRETSLGATVLLEAAFGVSIGVEAISHRLQSARLHGISARSSR